MEEKQIQDIQKWYDKNKALYENFSSEIASIIKKILERNNVPYHSIGCRVKEKNSFLEKCKLEKYEDPINQITDFSGIRIIAYTNSDVSKIAKILKEEFMIDEKKSINKAEILDTDKVLFCKLNDAPFFTLFDTKTA